MLDIKKGRVKNRARVGGSPNLTQSLMSSEKLEFFLIKESMYYTTA
jgi:hypothetical protein